MRPPKERYLIPSLLSTKGETRLMTDFPTWERIIMLIPALLVGFTVHEFMHAASAHYLGDPTAKNQGRLTLNPIKHLDPIGTIVLLVAGFGWAKPVPVNPDRLRNPRRDNVIVSVAGPVANLVAAGAFALLIHGLVMLISPTENQFFFQALLTIVQINLVLMIFNLIPIPPLDGSHVVEALLPRQYLRQWYKFSQYGIFVLLGIVLLLPGLIGELIYPPINLILGLFGLQ